MRFAAIHAVSGQVDPATAAATKRPGGETQKVLSRVGSVWLAGWLGLATFQANRAARAAEAS
ncbi:MAG: hypothetical protein ABSD85_17230 [Acidimicrobiales bacterium]